LSKRFPTLFIFLLPAALLLLAAPAMAATLDEAQQQFDAFSKSPDHRFAPATASRAQAYLGAAMLARDNNQPEQLDEGVARALSTLDEAKATAERFKRQYPELINYKNAAERTITAASGAIDPLKEPNPRRLLQDAGRLLDETVGFYESGDLNRTGQSVAAASDAYRSALNAALPALIDVAGDTFSKAISASAKKYAPQSYAAARDELQIVQQYIDGLSTTPPEHPERALQLSEQALEIARQVKIWRKDSGSHEGIVLKARRDRLALAETLEIPFDASDPSSDVSSDTIARTVAELKAELAAEKAAHESDRQRLEAEYQEKLQAGIEEQRSALLAEQSEKVSNLKEAFRAKLERETFDVKRQKQVRALFKKGDAEILANVDGSLLIRLTRLKFASGSSKVGSAYFDLLGRLKEALKIYGDRKVRIEGHTDSKGDVQINRKISLKRAEAVRDFLIAAGMDGSRLKALGYGEVRPIASNEFEKGRAMNRRIDVVIEAPGK